MFPRFNRRFKDGKEHRYWNIVEKKRCAGGKVVQRQVLYLGEINDGQRELRRLLEPVVPNEAKWALPICVQKPSATKPAKMRLLSATRTEAAQLAADQGNRLVTL